jgi:hypothetical protein
MLRVAGTTPYEAPPTIPNECTCHGYGLDKQIHHIHNPRPATREELEVYHDPQYIDFLSKQVRSHAESGLSF